MPGGTQEKMQLQSFLDFAARYLALSDKTYVGEAAINSDPPCRGLLYYGQRSGLGRFAPLPIFLTFVGDDTRKIAYAVSFGKDELPAEHADTIRPWVGKFDKISVREKSGVDICYDLCRKSAVHVPDPTLLIDKEKVSSRRCRTGGLYFLLFHKSEYRKFRPAG